MPTPLLPCSRPGYSPRLLGRPLSASSRRARPLSRRGTSRRTRCVSPRRAGRSRARQRTRSRAACSASPSLSPRCRVPSSARCCPAPRCVQRGGERDACTASRGHCSLAVLPLLQDPTPRPLAERSALLLLLLAHNCRSGLPEAPLAALANPYRTALASVEDSAPAVPAAAKGAKPAAPAAVALAVGVSFKALFKALTLLCDYPLGTALLYTLMQVGGQWGPGAMVGGWGNVGHRGKNASLAAPVSPPLPCRPRRPSQTTCLHGQTSTRCSCRACSRWGVGRAERVG